MLAALCATVLARVQLGGFAGQREHQAGRSCWSRPVLEASTEPGRRAGDVSGAQQGLLIVPVENMRRSGFLNNQERKASLFSLSKVDTGTECKNKKMGYVFLAYVF